MPRCGASEIIQIDSLTAQKRMVEAGFGFALLPASSVAEELRSDTLCAARQRHEDHDPGRADPSAPRVSEQRDAGTDHNARRLAEAALAVWGVMRNGADILVFGRDGIQTTEASDELS